MSSGAEKQAICVFYILTEVISFSIFQTATVPIQLDSFLVFYWRS